MLTLRQEKGFSVRNKRGFQSCVYYLSKINSFSSSSSFPFLLLLFPLLLHLLLSFSLLCSFFLPATLLFLFFFFLSLFPLFCFIFFFLRLLIEHLLVFALTWFAVLNSLATQKGKIRSSNNLFWLRFSGPKYLLILWVWIEFSSSLHYSIYSQLSYCRASLLDTSSWWLQTREWS